MNNAVVTVPDYDCVIIPAPHPICNRNDTTPISSDNCDIIPVPNSDSNEQIYVSKLIYISEYPSLQIRKAIIWLVTRRYRQENILTYHTVCKNIYEHHYQEILQIFLPGPKC